MHERFHLPLSLWKVQYHLLGGHRRVAGVAVIYATLLIVGALAFRRLMRLDPLPQVAGLLVNGLSVIQVLVLFLGGCNAVYRCTLRDHQTRMVESHRLTPMSSLSVVLGYLSGSTLQIGILFLINLAFGLVLQGLAGSPVGPWMYGNTLLLTGAVMLWALMVFSGMRLAKPISPGPILLGVGLLGVAAGVFVPGAALFLAAYSVMFGCWTITGLFTVAPLAVIGVMAVNLLLTAFWMFAAAAKYRRPDLPALNAVRGLLFLFLWLSLATVGIVAFDAVTSTRMIRFHDETHLRVQWIATMISSLIVASVAVSGAVQCRLLVARGAAPRDWTDHVSGGFAAVAAALLICLVMALVGGSVWVDLYRPMGVSANLNPALPLWLWGYTVAACVLAMLTIRAVFVISGAFLRSAPVAVGLFVVFAWGGPPLVDLIRANVVQDGWGPLVLSVLLGCSPAGTIAAVWAPVAIPVWPGLLIQLGLLLVLAVAAHRWRERACSQRQS